MTKRRALWLFAMVTLLALSSSAHAGYTVQQGVDTMGVAVTTFLSLPMTASSLAVQCTGSAPAWSFLRLPGQSG